MGVPPAEGWGEDQEQQSAPATRSRSMCGRVVRRTRRSGASSLTGRRDALSMSTTSTEFGINFDNGTAMPFLPAAGGEFAP